MTCLFTAAYCSAISNAKAHELEHRTTGIIDSIANGIIINHDFFCLHLKLKTSQDKPIFCLTRRMFEGISSPLAFDEIYKMARLSYLKQDVIAIYYRSNVYAHANFSTLLSHKAILGIATCYKFTDTGEAIVCLGSTSN